MQRKMQGTYESPVILLECGITSVFKVSANTSNELWFALPRYFIHNIAGKFPDIIESLLTIAKI